MDELKPCPHCGGEVRYFNGWKFGNRARDVERGREPSISCNLCGSGFGQGYFGRGISDEEAEQHTIAAWNRRSGEGEVETAPEEQMSQTWKDMIAYKTSYSALLADVEKVRDTYKKQLEAYNTTPLHEQSTWVKSKCFALSGICDVLTTLIDKHRR